MNDFLQIRGAVVRGAPLKLHGSSTLFYTHLSDCAAVCSAAIECSSFVHNMKARPPFCAFKRTAESHKAQAGKETFVKRAHASPVAHPVPAPVQLTAQLWSNASRVFLLKGLLTAHEAAALHDLAVDCFRRQRREVRTSNTASEKTTIGTAGCPSGAQAALLSSVEARLSAVTGLAWHEAEEPIMLTRQRPRASGAPLDGSRLHHDQINAEKERRHATVLTYLSDVEDHEGGHTIFPMLRPIAAHAEPAEPADHADHADHAEHADHARGDDALAAISLEAFARTAQQAFTRGSRSIGCHECAQHARIPPTADEAAEMSAAQQHAEAECRRALTGQTIGTAVRPRAGDAVVFWHVQPNGEPDPTMWHAGCIGRSGPGRVALQKFKTPMTEAEAKQLSAALEAREVLRWDVRADGGQGDVLDSSETDHVEDLKDAVASAEFMMDSLMDL